MQGSTSSCTLVVSHLYTSLLYSVQPLQSTNYEPINDHLLNIVSLVHPELVKSLITKTVIASLNERIENAGRAS